MLADIVYQIEERIHQQPVSQYRDAGGLVIANLGLRGQFEAVGHTAPCSISYNGNILVQMLHKKARGEKKEFVEIDPCFYEGLPALLEDLKRYTLVLIERSGETYIIDGMNFQSSNIWFSLKRTLGPEELIREIQSIKRFFPEFSEIFAP